MERCLICGKRASGGASNESEVELEMGLEVLIWGWRTFAATW
jgi:hypothetical protein